MKIYLKFDENVFPPKLTLSVKGAPHSRQHRAIFKTYRNAIWEAWEKAGYNHQIDYPIDLDVIFCDPASPDLDHTLMALYSAIDGKSTLKGNKNDKSPRHPALMTDDGYISEIRMRNFWPNEATRADNRIY
jgi:hypothetical protein